MKSKKIKNALLIVLSLALVSAVTVAITWAAKTEDALQDPKTNTFTNNPNISVQMKEEAFDGLDWGGTRGDNDANVDKTNGDLGYNKARAYKSGDTIPKNPMLKNSTSATFAPATSANKNGVTSDEWVAIGLQYSIKVPSTVYEAYAANNKGSHDGSSQANAIGVHTFTPTYANNTITFKTYADFAATIATVDAFSSSWTDISATSGAKTLFAYNSKLTVDAESCTTSALFDNVVINTIASKYVYDGTNYAQYFPIEIKNGYYGGSRIGTGSSGDYSQTIYVNNLPEFKIQLTGFAVQGDNLAGPSVTTNSCKDELQALAATKGI